MYVLVALATVLCAMEMSPSKPVLYARGEPVWSFAAKPLVLLGLPGAGKSTVGRAMEVHGFRQIDNDAEIEKDQGVPAGRLCDVADAHAVEDFFRLEEKVFINRFQQDSGIVYTPGGSIVHCPRALELMMAHGIVVWLDSPDEDAFDLDPRARGIVLPEGLTLRDRRPLHKFHHHVKVDMHEHRKNEQAVGDMLAQLVSRAARGDDDDEYESAHWTMTSYKCPRPALLHRMTSDSTASTRADSPSGSSSVDSPLYEQSLPPHYHHECENWDV